MKRRTSQEQRLWQSEVKRRWRRLLHLEGECQARLRDGLSDDESAELVLLLKGLRLSILSTYLDTLEAGIPVDLFAQAA